MAQRPIDVARERAIAAGAAPIAVTPAEADPTALGVGPVPVTIHPDTFFGLSIIEASKKFLKLARRAQHVTAIAAALEQGGLKRPSDNVMSGILVRAAKGCEVTKVGKGMWGLSDWYPKPPKDLIEDRKKQEKKKRPDQRKAKAFSAKKAPTPAPAKKAAPKGAAAPAERAAQNGSVSGSAARPSDVALAGMREAGKPLHAVEITKQVNERGVTASRLTVESFLNRQAKVGKMQKTAPEHIRARGRRLGSVPAGSRGLLSDRGAFRGRELPRSGLTTLHAPLAPPARLHRFGARPRRVVLYLARRHVKDQLGELIGVAGAGGALRHHATR